MSWFHTLYPYGGIGVFRDFYGISFSLNRVENTGAAWGLFSHFSGYLFFLRCAIALTLLVYLLFFNKISARVFPLLLILAGATGNIVDFLLYGYVVDLFHFNFWGYTFPVFNVADMCIFLGVLAIFFVNKGWKLGKS